MIREWRPGRKGLKTEVRGSRMILTQFKPVDDDIIDTVMKQDVDF
jgi:hypothetical protein